MLQLVHWIIGSSRFDSRVRFVERVNETLRQDAAANAADLEEARERIKALESRVARLERYFTTTH